jgi:hypothetical protein
MGGPGLGSGAHMTDYTRDREQGPIGGHAYRHGRPASWVLVAVIIAAFSVGGVALISHLWWLFWVCAGVVAVSVPAGKVIGIMHDTVVVDSGPRRLPSRVGPNSAADPGVRLD